MAMTTKDLKDKISELLIDYAQDNRCSISLEAHIKRTYSDITRCEIECYDLEMLDMKLGWHE